MPTNIEQATSKVMGAAKAVKGTLKGLSGVFKTLMKEHGEVSALLLRVKSSTDPELRARLWPTIRKELLSHEKAEMAVVYPVFREHPETAAIAAKHDGETPELEAAIARLTRMDFADADWGPAFEQLVALVMNHVNEEESSWFPAGNKAFGSLSESLDAPYKNAKAEAIAQLG